MTGLCSQEDTLAQIGLPEAAERSSATKFTSHTAFMQSYDVCVSVIKEKKKNG